MRKRSEVAAQRPAVSKAALELEKLTAGCASAPEASTEDRSSVALKAKTPAALKRKGDELKVPHDPINEQVIIAAACVDATTRRRLLLLFKPDAFFVKGHAAIWRALAEIESRGLSFDPATMQQIGGGDVDVEYLSQLVEQRSALPPNLAYHVEALKWDQVRIEALRGPIGSLLEALRDPSSDPDAVRTLGRQVGAAFNAADLRYLRDPVELVRSQVAEIRKRQAGLACYPYGIDGFDKYEDEGAGTKRGQWRMVPGMAPKQCTVITGISGTGKTTLTAQIVIGTAKQRRPVLFGAWEQGSGMTLELMAIQSLGMSRTAFMTGKLRDDEIDAVTAEMESLAEYVRFFELPFGRTPKEKKGQMNDRHLDLIHAYIAQSGCKVFVADLFRRALREIDPDEEEAALYRMQAILQETDAHGMLIHQQRLKDIEQRADTRPTREGLKGTGAWIEMPDTIIATHRPALFKAVDDTTVELVVLKQRHGVWPLAVECDWDPDTGVIRNGRTIEYARPGQTSAVDNFLNEAAPARKGRGKYVPK